MSEMLYIAAALIVVGAAIFVLRRRLEAVMAKVEVSLNLVANALVLFIMVFVTVEIASRYLFNSPIPGHLELSELFMPAIVYLSIAYTQSTGGHIQLSILVDNVPVSVRRVLDLFTLTLSLLTYAVLCFYTARIAWLNFVNNEVTMSPPYFKIWWSSAIVPLGIFLTSVRLYMELFSTAFPQWKLTRPQGFHIGSE